MVFPRRVARLFVLLLFAHAATGQVFSTARQRSFYAAADTLVLDSLSLVPGSVSWRLYPEKDSASARIDYRQHALVLSRPADSVQVTWRCFPYNFEKAFFHKDGSMLYSSARPRYVPYTVQYGGAGGGSLLQNDGLTKNGTISRGISFGNSQDMVLNSNLNLQVSGKLTPEIDLVMAATDNNIPFQADGTTAQLQEFDKVYIRLSNAENKLTVGDYQLSRPKESYFMNFYKRAQGINFENTYRDSASPGLTFRTQVSGAVSRGKFSRQVFFGTENNQGPYRLKGADNEPFIIVLSGTEKVYIDGKLLARGQENDYIIDYNTGEITFTARQLITKDRRIVAEFQYAERNYARSLFLFSETVESKRTRVFLDFYSEQDNRNKPLQQSLTQPQKDVLIDAGDSLSAAYFPGVEEAVFNSTDVFYRKTDSIVGDMIYPAVYVQSADPQLAKYRLKFSNVGVNRGNYVQQPSLANGRVYVWVAPVNGVPSGMYEPVIPLVTPKLMQMLTAGVTHSLTANNTVSVEGVYTKNDINRFSSAGKGNDEAGGTRLASINRAWLRGDSTSALLTYNVSYEYLQKEFRQVERFRSVEFERDWNRPLNGTLLNDQSIGTAEVGLSKGGASVRYGYSLFEEGSNYHGRRQVAAVSVTRPFAALSYQGSVLNTAASGTTSSRFYRHKSMVTKRVDRVKFAFSDEFENNRFSNGNGTLAGRSYQFWEWEGSVANADTTKNQVRVFYRERRDRLAYSDILRDSTFATNIGLRSSIYSIRNNPVTFMLTYRKLNLRHVVSDALKPDNNLLGRVEYNPRYFRGLVSAGVFYETGYGMENKKEFYYLEVAAGQGQYAWIDYNGNGVKELNEFETALYADQARYIRIYTPTSQYVKVLQNQASVSLNIRPSAYVKGVPGPLRRFVNRWALQTALRLDNKMQDNGRVNAFTTGGAVADSALLASNNNVRQSVFFNQSSAVFGADYTYTDNQSRQLLTNGIERRKLRSDEVRLRYSFPQAWSVNSSFLQSTKGNASQFLSTRNYLIHGRETEQRLIYQPGTAFRLSGIYKYATKRNAVEGGFQQAKINTVALELRCTQAEKGSLTGRADYIMIRYNDKESTSVAYEMLNGLSNGNNLTWELSYQRNLNSSIQVSISYNGRKTPTSQPVHLGSAQIKAFF